MKCPDCGHIDPHTSVVDWDGVWIRCSHRRSIGPLRLDRCLCYTPALVRLEKEESAQ